MINVRKLTLAAVAFFFSTAAAVAEKLPDPDGKEADMSQPVQVFILMGQSNMLGFGDAKKLKGIAADKYPYLVDDSGNWNIRKDVRNVFYCMGKKRQNDWLSAANGNGSGKFGPEVGIGNYLGHAIDAPVLILKSCVGNRALGWDLLPPSAKGTGVDGRSYEGNSESSNRKINTDISGWYAGRQYDDDVGAAQRVLKNLSDYYPGAKTYEVAGFFWWQGNAEKGKGSVENYDQNLACLFNDLRKDFNAPNAKFVCATLGEHDKSAALSQKMFAFADRQEFKDQAAVFYSKPVSRGGSGGHYGGDPNTYMDVGEGMGQKMLELIEVAGDTGGSSDEPTAINKPELLTDLQLSKLDSLLLKSLTRLSSSNSLREIPLKVSKTKAKVWLAVADDDGTMTYQLVGGQKQAKFKYDELSVVDRMILSRLVAALSPNSRQAAALAGLYIEFKGKNKSVAKAYFEKAGDDAIQSVVSQLE